VEAFYILSKLIDKNIISMNDVESVCEKTGELTDKRRDCVHRLYLPYPAFRKAVVICLFCDLTYLCDSCLCKILDDYDVSHTRKTKLIVCEECKRKVSVSV